MLLPSIAAQPGRSGYIAAAAPEPSGAMAPDDHPPASSSSSWEPDTIQSVVFGIVASLLALVTVYISCLQLRAMHRRRGQLPPIPRALAARRLQKRDAMKPQHGHQYLLMSLRVYFFHQR